MHGFSNRAMGNMKKDLAARKRFIDSVGIKREEVIVSEQVHGNMVSLVDQNSDMRVIDADGLVTKHSEFALGVFTADCVPIFFVDSVSRTIAVAHAGWRGTVGKIAQNTVELMKSTGSHARDILVWIGPHIGMCCYWVNQDRAKQFSQVFGQDLKLTSCSNSVWHLNLGYCNTRQLIDFGISPEHIDVSVDCTSCQNDIFFSYRKDTKETFGEMMGVIGWK